MCGIAGYSTAVKAAADSAWLDAARQALAHRGPDGDGAFEHRTCAMGLAHTRLSIVDLSPAGRQPMGSDDGRVVLVFNGEIYNFQELRAELEGQRHQFLGTSDTEVLLRLYLHVARREGVHRVAIERMLARLNGIFAFALWDEDQRAILVARDALGVKPLYFQCAPGRVHFASEMKALPRTAPTVDCVALERYLTYLWCPGERTPATEVRKLGPGEAMWIGDGAVRERFRWYRLPAERGVRPVAGDSPAFIRDTTAHVRRAVHRQMVADVPVGAFLSGGLDSSSVVAFARELDPDIQCFTIEAAGQAEEGHADDLPFARRVARHLRVPLHVVHVDAGRMAGDLAHLVAHLDEPLADPASLNVLYISRLARTAGIKVLLSGAGGDDLFTGYRRHRALMAESYWAWLPHGVRRSLASVSRHLDVRHPLVRRLAKVLGGAGLHAEQRLVHYFRWTDRADLARLFTPRFTAALGEATAEDPMRDFLKALPPGLSRLERLLSLEQRFFLADHNLTYTDKMSMAAGVEARVPFLDLELVEFAATIPARLKQRGTEGKWILKKAMESMLPRDVIYRPKTGFGAPLRQWMRFELRDLVADLLSASRLQRRGLFVPGEVQRLIAANDAGRIDASYTLLSLMCVELWCQQFIDRTNPELSPS